MENGGELLAKTLAGSGVRVAFGVHGGHLDPFFAACEQADIDLFDFRHEAAAVNAADSYARTTGMVGVAFATASSGFMNGVAGLASCFADHSPVLLITSAPPLRDFGTNTLQGGLDQIAIASPVTKWAVRVTNTEEIVRLVTQAICTAYAEPKGPVLLELPVDILARRVRADRVSPAGRPASLIPPAPADHAVDEILQLLVSAARPVVIVGAEAAHKDIVDALVEFAERTSVPIFFQRPYSPSFPANHPLNGNDVGRLKLLIDNGQLAPDLALLLGARFGLFLGGRNVRILPPECELVHVSRDAREIGLLRSPALGLVADVRTTVEALTSRLDPQATVVSDRLKWAEATTSLRVQFPSKLDGIQKLRLSPLTALREVFRCLPSHATLVFDGGEAGQWGYSSLPVRHSFTTLFAPGYLGFLGASTGMSIGAAVADPETRVVLLQGDGAAGFHLQEMETMVRRRLRILVIVVNNAMWGMSKHGQEMQYGTGNYRISDLPDTAFERVAAGFGMPGQRIRTLAEIQCAVLAALAFDGPYCLNLAVSADIVHPDTAEALRVDESPTVLSIPYYDNFPID